MSIALMTVVWAIDLPDSQKLVLLALADAANDEGHCWPSMASLARKCSKGERTVQGVIKALETAGHITRRENPGKGCDYLVHPRSGCAPQKPHPRSERRKPPQPLRTTPAAAADKPKENHKEPSKGKVAASDDAPLSVNELVSDWNEFAAPLGLRQVVVLSDARRKKAASRLKRFPDIKLWRRAFSNIRGSPFCLGENERGWKADFDFLLQDKSFAKLIEGSYGQD